MSKAVSQHPEGHSLYAEDRCALRWPVLFNGIFWPVLILLCILPLATTRDPNLVILFFPPLLGFGLTMGPTLLVFNWPTGIRVDANGIRIGGIRRADRHYARGHQHAESRKLPPVTSQRGQVFFCPWSGIQRIEVVTERAELRKLTKVGRDIGIRATKVAGLGRLWAPYMKAALVINVDVNAATIPQFRPPDTKRPWFRMPYMTQYYPSPVWFAPTRHPEALRAALTQLNVPSPARPPGDPTAPYL